jgi:hypothetical protein
MTATKSKLTKRPISKAEINSIPLDERAVEAFVNKAPDGSPTPAPEKAERKGVKRGNREQISHTITPELLAKVDERAKLEGQTRAGLINLAIARYVNN